MSRLVSVIIPTYNRANTIEKSIRSVLDQTYQDIELIIIDDASSDNTRDVVANINDHRLKYYRNDHNRGVAFSRNAGVEHACGEYIAFQDSDDVWNEDKLQKQMDVIDKNEDCEFVYCAFERIYRNGTRKRIPRTTELVSELSGHMFDKLLKYNVISTQTMLVKKDLFERIGGFDPDFRAMDDYELALRISQKTNIYYVDEVLVKVYESIDSISDSSHYYVQQYRAHLRLLKKYMDVLDDKSKTTNIFAALIRYAVLLSKKDFLIEMKSLEESFDNGFGLVRLIKERRKFDFKDGFMREIFEKNCETILARISEMSAETFAIYGNGYIGKILRDVLLKNGYRVSCVIDRNNHEEDYHVMGLDDEFPEVDAILISVYQEEETIKEYLREKTKSDIVYLDELLEG